MGPCELERGASSECSPQPPFLNHTRPRPFHQLDVPCKGIFVLMSRRKGLLLTSVQNVGFCQGWVGDDDEVCRVHLLHLLCHHFVSLCMLINDSISQSVFPDGDTWTDATVWGREVTTRSTSFNQKKNCIYWENVKQSLNGTHAELAMPCAFNAEGQPFGTGS